MKKLIQYFLLLFAVLGDVHSDELLLSMGEEIDGVESLWLSKENERALENFEKVFSINDEEHRYAVYMLKSDNGADETIHIEFKKDEKISPEDTDFYQDLLEWTARYNPSFKLPWQKTINEIANDHMDRKKKIYGKDVTSEIETSVTKDSLLIHTDLLRDHERAEKFWSICKILLTPDGFHRVSYLCNGELRNPDKSKKSKELIEKFTLITTVKDKEAEISHPIDNNLTAVSENALPTLNEEKGLPLNTLEN